LSVLFQVVQKEKETKKDEGKKKDVQATKRQSVKDLANKLKSQVHDGPPMLRKKGIKVVFNYSNISSTS